MTILVLVADGALARLLAAHSQASDLDDWQHFEHPRSRARNRDLTSDGPGTGRGSAAYGRHTMGHEGEPHRHEEEAFATELCAQLDAALPQGISKIYLIAPARFLGMLRKAISKHAKKLVVKELELDLVGADNRAIRHHLPQFL